MIIIIFQEVPMKLNPSAEYAMKCLVSAGFPAWVVGGCVRDSLLGLEPADWDICTSALPEQTLSLFDRVAVTGAKHGTVTAILDRPVEITTLRTEGKYTDHRHPSEVNFTNDICADLARRDFTVNAMAWSPDEGLVDPFGGKEDLESKILKCVGNPGDRFAEDALRLLRALRFISRFGFSVETETDYAMHLSVPFLKDISSERIYSELTGILHGAYVEGALLPYADIITEAIPELKPMVGFEQHTPHHIYDVWEHTVHAISAAPSDGPARLILLFHDMAKPEKYVMGTDGRGHFMGHGAAGADMAETCLRRLGADRGTRELVKELVTVHDDPLPTSEADMRRLLAKLGAEKFRLLLAVKRADGSSRNSVSAAGRFELIAKGEALADAILARDPCLSLAELKIGGAELKELGIPQSSEIGHILGLLFDDVLEGSLENTREALLERAKEIMEQTH